MYRILVLNTWSTLYGHSLTVCSHFHHRICPVTHPFSCFLPLGLILGLCFGLLISTLCTVLLLDRIQSVCVCVCVCVLGQSWDGSGGGGTITSCDGTGKIRESLMVIWFILRVYVKKVLSTGKIKSCMNNPRLFLVYIYTKITFPYYVAI